jgi:arginase family enzyme
MDISMFFEPVQLKGHYPAEKSRHKRLGEVVKIFSQPDQFPEYVGAELAILGISEDRAAVGNPGCDKAPDAIREEFYKLFPGNFKPNIVDLGNLLRGHTVEDTYFALTSTVEELLRNNVLPIVLGGSQDATFCLYRAYEKVGRIINIAIVDPMFDLGQSEHVLDSRSYMSHIILQQPNFLFNFTNIGYQTYYVDQAAIALMNNLMFDSYRLGFIRHDMEEVEPMVRNADILSVDIGAVRMSDAPGNASAGPNGFYGEEICQITRYAGLSDKMSSFGVFEYNPKFDNQSQTAKLISQMIWYFIEGFYGRKQDYPLEKKSDFKKFTVTTKDFKDEIVFYKSKKSDRWWMEVPIRSRAKTKYMRHHLVPCSYKDYKTALANHIPDRWWQTYKKLM